MYAEYIDKRIVVRCLNELAFAGVCKKIYEFDEKKYVIVETDKESGFCVMIPFEFIEKILCVPISESE